MRASNFTYNNPIIISELYTQPEALNFDFLGEGKMFPPQPNATPWNEELASIFQPIQSFVSVNHAIEWLLVKRALD